MWMMCLSETEVQNFFTEMRGRFELKEIEYLTSQQAIMYLGTKISMTERDGKTLITVSQVDDIREFLIEHEAWGGRQNTARTRCTDPLWDR